VTKLREFTQDQLIEYVTGQRWYGSRVATSPGRASTSWSCPA
jgi:hypothetical protein